MSPSPPTGVGDKNNSNAKRPASENIHSNRAKIGRWSDPRADKEQARTDRAMTDRTVTKKGFNSEEFTQQRETLPSGRTGSSKFAAIGDNYRPDSYRRSDEEQKRKSLGSSYRPGYQDESRRHERESRSKPQTKEPVKKVDKPNESACTKISTEILRDTETTDVRAFTKPGLPVEVEHSPSKAVEARSSAKKFIASKSASSSPAPLPITVVKATLPPIPAAQMAPPPPPPPAQMSREESQPTSPPPPPPPPPADIQVPAEGLAQKLVSGLPTIIGAYIKSATEATKLEKIVASNATGLRFAKPDVKEKLEKAQTEQRFLADSAQKEFASAMLNLHAEVKAACEAMIASSAPAHEDPMTKLENLKGQLAAHEEKHARMQSQILGLLTRDKDREEALTKLNRRLQTLEADMPAVQERAKNVSIDLDQHDKRLKKWEACSASTPSDNDFVNRLSKVERELYESDGRLDNIESSVNGRLYNLTERIESLEASSKDVISRLRAIETSKYEEAGNRGQDKKNEVALQNVVRDVERLKASTKAALDGLTTVEEDVKALKKKSPCTDMKPAGSSALMAVANGNGGQATKITHLGEDFVREINSDKMAKLSQKTNTSPLELEKMLQSQADSISTIKKDVERVQNDLTGLAHVVSNDDSSLEKRLSKLADYCTQHTERTNAIDRDVNKMQQEMRSLQNASRSYSPAAAVGHRRVPSTQRRLPKLVDHSTQYTERTSAIDGDVRKMQQQIGSLQATSRSQSPTGSVALGDTTKHLLDESVGYAHLASKLEAMQKELQNIDFSRLKVLPTEMEQVRSNIDNFKMEKANTIADLQVAHATTAEMVADLETRMANSFKQRANKIDTFVQTINAVEQRVNSLWAKLETPVLKRRGSKDSVLSESDDDVPVPTLSRTSPKAVVPTLPQSKDEIMELQNDIDVLKKSPQEGTNVINEHLQEEVDSIKHTLIELGLVQNDCTKGGHLLTTIYATEKKLEDWKASVQSQVNAQKQRLDALGDSNALSAEVFLLKSNIATLSKEVGAVIQDLNALKERTRAQLPTEEVKVINHLKAEVGILQALSSKLDQDVETLKTLVRQPRSPEYARQYSKETSVAGMLSAVIDDKIEALQKDVENLLSQNETNKVEMQRHLGMINNAITSITNAHQNFNQLDATIRRIDMQDKARVAALNSLEDRFDRITTVGLAKMVLDQLTPRVLAARDGLYQELAANLTAIQQKTIRIANEITPWREVIGTLTSEQLEARMDERIAAKAAEITPGGASRQAGEKEGRATDSAELLEKLDSLRSQYHGIDARCIKIDDPALQSYVGGAIERKMATWGRDVEQRIATSLSESWNEMFKTKIAETLGPNFQEYDGIREQVTKVISDNEAAHDWLNDLRNDDAQSKRDIEQLRGRIDAIEKECQKARDTIVVASDKVDQQRQIINADYTVDRNIRTAETSDNASGPDINIRGSASASGGQGSVRTTPRRKEAGMKRSVEITGQRGNGRDLLEKVEPRGTSDAKGTPNRRDKRVDAFDSLDSGEEAKKRRREERLRRFGTSQ